MASDSRDQAFLTQLEPHRRAITAHCYRMLGSLHDAEELAQDSLLRAWQRLDELRSSAATKAWLYQIATNACLDVLRTRPRRILPPEVAAAGDPTRPPLPRRTSRGCSPTRTDCSRRSPPPRTSRARRSWHGRRSSSPSSPPSSTSHRGSGRC
jgi:RNA polymerase sigma factor (sigma-70 family)